MTNYIFVYGTLKQGGCNNYLLNGCKFIGHGWAKGCVLINLGAFPGMMPGKVKLHDHDDDAVGEVYSVPDEILPHVLRTLDRLENRDTMYVRVQMDIITISGAVPCITYLYMPTLNTSAIIKGGDWTNRRA